MDGYQFEQYVALLLKALGYQVSVTPKSKDYGADLLLIKGEKKIVVQVKRHRKSVGIGAVQEVAASMRYYKATEAWVITNDDFTVSARQLASSNDVRLIDRKGLTELILSVHPDLVPIPRNVLRDIPAKEIICERCGAKMVQRKSASGLFYGCSRFPKCRYTLSRKA
ncbi:restriction endonuclease [Brevibacillus humidisoli]|uniref:restriction endonuclease n=1 Tax=Brevibacillus humidisoli TaxID=2895522 RepID=UPI001E36FF5F|nr:restriction endonuclease [Brevibacillus humidisoli]UFJ41338.1 restriction endonuclease [Brevibacillus humidisoli]